MPESEIREQILKHHAQQNHLRAVYAQVQYLKKTGRVCEFPPPEYIMDMFFTKPSSNLKTVEEQVQERLKGT